MIVDARPINVAIGGTEQELTAAIYRLFRGDLSEDMARQLGQRLRKLHQESGNLSDEAVAAVIDGLDFSAWEPLAEAVERPLAAIAVAAAIAALSRVGIADNEPEARTARKFAERWAAERSAELIGMKRAPSGKLVPNPKPEAAITESTRDMVRQAVVRAVKDGWTNERLAEELRGMNVFSPERAERIARTELNGAVNGGQFAAYRESGLIVGKRWVTKHDNRVEVHCRENEKAGVIPLDDPFPSGHMHPLAHPNCRCHLAAAIG